MKKTLPLLITGVVLINACSDDPPPAPPNEKPPDTTSHEISWSVSYLGDAETVLSKLFVVGDSIVYVVGRIRVRDSVGRLVSYNAARWDGGDTWSLLQIPVLICGTDFTSPAELTTGFGFRESRLKFFTNNLTEKTDSGYRTDCELQFKLYGSIQNVFAYSEDDYYIVGGNSTVIHWNGMGFIREETGTRWETRDIYGNEHELWVVAGTPSARKGGVIHKLRQGSWGAVDSLSDGGNRSVGSVWCDERSYQNGGFVILAGRGIWYRDTTWRRPPNTVTSGGAPHLGDLYFSAVRGRARNDVFAVGDFDIVAHYNGRTWAWYPEIYNYPNGGILTSIALTKEDVFISRAHADGKGRIIHGRRK